MKTKNLRAASMLLIVGMPVVAFGCGDDNNASEPGVGGTSIGYGGSAGSTAGKGNAGKGGNNAEAGRSTGGTKAYAGSTGDGGEGGEDPMSAGGSAGGGGNGGAGGNAGVGGSAGAGGAAGGKGGAGGVSGAAASAGGGASGGGAGGVTGGGGSSGAGGGAGGPTCGNGVVNDGEACDPIGGPYAIDDCGGNWGEAGLSTACQLITPLACATCEAQSECSELTASSKLTGVAADGPAAGVKRSELYNRTLDCIRDTNCAAGLTIDCYCGTASGSDCDNGKGNGKCRTIIEQGLETTKPADIQARYQGVQYGAGLALARVNCDQQNCVDACFLPL